jgi:glycosyltransferase involved in cell wall biosynthesis
VDDGSSDTTDEVVGEYTKKDTRFKYYHRPEEHLPGGNGARNYGFKMSQGEYIQWFDSDDLMLPEKLGIKVKELKDNDINFVIGSMSLLTKGKINRSEVLRIENNLFKDYVLWNFKIYTPSILFRKSDLNSFRFNEKILRGQETEFLSNFFWKNFNFKYKIIDTPLFLYRQHNSSKTFANKSYNSKFKESQTIINFQNFNRGVILKDADLMNYIYSDLVRKFFDAITNDDKYLVKTIYSFLLRNKQIRYQLGITSCVLLSFSASCNLDSFRLRRHLLKKKWKMVNE